MASTFSVKKPKHSPKEQNEGGKTGSLIRRDRFTTTELTEQFPECVYGLHPRGTSILIATQASGCRRNRL